MMGSGKSTLGKALGAKIHVPFIDLDQEIEQQANRTITQIFNESGESYFRELETTVLQDLSAKASQFVMAVGGGTPCYHNNAEWMLKSGICIYLDVSMAELVKRLTSTMQKRPLLAGKNQQEIRIFLNQMFTERISFYALANHHLKGDSLSENDILDFIN